MTCHWPPSTPRVSSCSEPSANSFVYWFMRPNIWGRNAAIVSAFTEGGVWLVTNKPSFIARSAPAAPGRCATFAMISLMPNRFPIGPTTCSNEAPLLTAGVETETGRDGVDGTGAEAIRIDAGAGLGLGLAGTAAARAGEGGAKSCRTAPAGGVGCATCACTELV